MRAKTRAKKWITHMQIITSSPEVLRSIMAEAGRQSDYLASRGLTPQAAFWRDLERLAFAAKVSNSELRITFESAPLTGT